MASDPMLLYYTKWLPRARRLLTPSGRLTELALVLAERDEVTPEDWRARLRRILDGQERPDADLVFEVERFVARPLENSTTEEGPLLELVG